MHSHFLPSRAENVSMNVSSKNQVHDPGECSAANNDIAQPSVNPGIVLEDNQATKQQGTTDGEGLKQEQTASEFFIDDAEETSAQEVGATVEYVHPFPKKEFIAFYDRLGRAVFYLHRNKNFFSYNGTPLGYQRKDLVVSFSGHYVGWIYNDAIFVFSGECVFFTAYSWGAPRRPHHGPRPIREIRKPRPVKSVRQVKPCKAGITGTWSELSVSAFWKIS